MPAERSLHPIPRTLLVALLVLSAAALGSTHINEPRLFSLLSCRCCLADTLIVRPGSSHFMSSNESYGCVIVLPGAALYTGPHDLTVTCEDGLVVKGGGWIVIEDGGLLRLAEKSDMNGHMTNGVILLEGASSELRIEQNAALQGNGSLRIANASAKIFIAPGMTLTSKINIEGIGIIESDFDITFGNGTFANEGMVVANGSGALVLGSDLDLTDTGSSLWKAEGSSAVLRFLKNATGLDGQVRADEGTIEIGSGVSLATSGRLTGEDGGLVIACDATFAATGTPLPTGFTSPLSDNRFLFDDTDSGANQNNCP